MSPPPPLPEQGKHPGPLQDPSLGLFTNSYTQCSQAYPQLLRTMSDPSLSLGGTATPTPSLQPSDFPPLPGQGNTGDMGQLSEMNFDGNTLQTYFGPPPVSPQPQRQTRHNASRSTEQGTNQTKSYAQVTSSPSLIPMEGRDGSFPSHSQRLTWGDRTVPQPQQWDPRGSASFQIIREPSPSHGPQNHKEQDHHLQHPTSWQDCLQAIPTKEDFRLLIEEVKSACRAEIQVIHTNLKHLSDRVEMAEEEIQETKLAVHRTQVQGADHHIMLRNMQRHLEDLDNRGRRNNIRVRGLPESEGPEDLHETLQLLFNNLLGDPPNKPIEMDRAHRALRPKGPISRPRDVICRVHSFPLKEVIMRKARTTKKILFENTQVQLFPDLSWITLQKRRLLQPLLILLQENDITYRWGFPFSLTARRQGKTAVLRFPEDVENFCDTMEIPPPRLPEWDLVDLPTPPPVVWQKVPPTKRPRDRDSPSGSTKTKPKKG